MWSPEAPRQPYPWAAAFGGHLSIGVALWIACAGLGPWWGVVAASALYSAWEIWSARRWGLLAWDSTLDWVGVTFGALTAAALWTQGWPLATWCCASSMLIAYAGWRTRSDNPSDNGA